MEASLHQSYGFALVLLRTAGLFLSAPVLSARVVPPRARLALALVASLAIYTGSGSPRVAPPESLLGLAATAAVETAFGLVAGLAARWVLEAAVAAGHVIGLSMGLGFGSLVDPSSGGESSPVSQFLMISAQAGAVAFGIHREALAWLARSSVVWPPGGRLVLTDLALRAVGQATVCAALAVRVAFPVLAAVLLGHAVVGVIGRTAPQFNLSTVGFSMAVLAGGLALYLVAPGAADLVARQAAAAFPR
jgi:flagellar biosynthesis protein FliR